MTQASGWPIAKLPIAANIQMVQGGELLRVANRPGWQIAQGRERPTAVCVCHSILVTFETPMVYQLQQ